EPLVGAAPARVTVHIDGGRPERQRTIVVRRGAEVVLGNSPQRLVQQAPRLIGDRGGLLVSQLRVPRHGGGKVGGETGRVHPARRTAVVGVVEQGVDAVL